MQPLAATKLLVEAVLAVTALAGVIASSPLLVAKARLIRERDQARKEADALRDIVAAVQTGLSALDYLRQEVVEIRAVQIIATRYIVDLVAHIRDSAGADSMPDIPPELHDDVLNALRNRVRAAAAAAAATAIAVKS